MGERFKTDPLTILDVKDMDWIIRLACDKVLERDREQAQNNKQPSIFD